MSQQNERYLRLHITYKQRENELSFLSILHKLHLFSVSRDLFETVHNLLSIPGADITKSYSMNTIST